MANQNITDSPAARIGVASGDLFSIRPLAWTKNFQDWRQEWSAQVPMGSYKVARIREECDPEKPWQSWQWEYCFDEYYDEGNAACKNPEDGKNLAWADWLKRITPALARMENAKLSDASEAFAPASG